MNQPSNNRKTSGRVVTSDTTIAHHLTDLHFPLLGDDILRWSNEVNMNVRIHLVNCVSRIVSKSTWKKHILILSAMVYPAHSSSYQCHSYHDLYFRYIQVMSLILFNCLEIEI